MTIETLVTAIAKNVTPHSIESQIKLIQQWALDRNFPSGATTSAQCMKWLSEMGEMADGIAKGRPNEIHDGVGDTAVVAIVLATMMGHDLSVMAGEDVLISELIDKVHSEANIMASSPEELLCTLNMLILQTIQGGYDNNNILVMFTLLDGIAKKFDSDLLSCLKLAYGEIKDRKGKMINGAFVKEADL